MTTDRDGAVVARASGRIMRGQASDMEVRLGAAESGGAYTIVELAIRPGGRTRPHYHLKLYESWYLIEGELEARVGDEWRTVRAGDMVHLPVGVAHCYRNTGGEQARMLVIAAPGGVERFFDELAELVSASPGGVPEFEELRELNRRHDFVLLEE